jgi:hypothetical protein
MLRMLLAAAQTGRPKPRGHARRGRAVGISRMFRALLVAHGLVIAREVSVTGCRACTTIDWLISNGMSFE